MKTAYKGTDKNMKCRDTQFEVGKTYSLDDDENLQELPKGYTIIKTDIKLCSKKAIHYCDELEKTFSFYPNNGENRFFKIEVLGDFIDEHDKSGARCIRFIEEVSKESLDELRYNLDSKMKIPTVKRMQENNPHLIIGGSIALYLMGVRLERFKNGAVDFDITLPFYSVIQGETVQDLEERPSGSDYGETITINGIKADIRIDPKQKYEIIKYKDFNYKVIPLATIIKAKAEYALTKWGLKHKQDLQEMILNKITKPSF
jgi:hypothetical protein